MIRDLQRIQIKVASNAPHDLNLDPLLVIFSRWRKEKEHPAEWVDLADYAHVPRGPGIVLIGQRCNLAFNMADPAPGILYSAKKGLSGSYPQRIQSALEWCFELSRRLIAEPEFPPGIHLKTDSLEIRFLDRLETPNTAATDQQLRPLVEQTLHLLYGEGAYELRPATDPKLCYGFSVRAKSAPLLDALLARITEKRSP